MLGFLSAILAGAAMSVQGVMNTRLGEKVGTLETNAFVQLVGFLLFLLSHHAHGEQGHQRNKADAKAAQRIFKIGHGAVDVVQHGAKADELQQKCPEHIGQKAV